MSLVQVNQRSGTDAGSESRGLLSGCFPLPAQRQLRAAQPWGCGEGLSFPGH